MIDLLTANMALSRDVFQEWTSSEIRLRKAKTWFDYLHADIVAVHEFMFQAIINDKKLFLKSDYLIFYF